MKVLQINSVYVERSTGRNCFELEKAIEAAGGQCVTAYGFGPRRNSPNAYKIGTKFEYYFHNVMGRITGLCGYFSVSATLRLVRFIRKYDPDVIHLHNLHAFYVNLPILFRYLEKSGKPVILNLHDCWSFTGKCAHYTANGCYRWQTVCGHCPKRVIRGYPQSLLFDWSKKMFLDKKKWLCSLKRLTVVGVSGWIADQARLSFLRDREITWIYNWIDTDVFKPYDTSVFSEYGIPENRFTVFCAGVSWGKQTSKYQELAQIIQKADKDIQFVVAGHVDEPFEGDNVYHVGYVSDIRKLAQLNSSADVYVHFSVEDTFGKVIAEALACGTPAIVYRSTACQEIVDSTCGMVVESHDVNAVLDAILEIKRDPQRYSAEQCCRRVRENFLYRTNTDQFLQLYRRLMDQDT